MTHAILDDAIALLTEAIEAELYPPSIQVVLHHRLKQLKRRADESRVFVAFIGEKKAGKTALVRALTQVPLPTAVRECTAAVCEIQVGQSLQHEASFGEGKTRTFSAIDDSHQQAVLSVQQKKDLEATRHAAEHVALAERKLQKAQVELQTLKHQIEQLEKEIESDNNALSQVQGSQPWLFQMLKPFSWMSQAIGSRLDTIDELSEQIKVKIDEHQQHRQQFQAVVDNVVTEKAAVSTSWERARSMAIGHQKSVDEAKAAVDAVQVENENKFAADLSEFIDVTKRPAEHVRIQSPNSDIPNNLVLLDTPGLNTDRDEHRRRAWTAIEELADICILVSDLRQPLPDTVMDMLDRLIPYCPELHVVLTKKDLALRDARAFTEEPYSEVKEAIDFAESRIAKSWPHPLNVWAVASIEPNDQLNVRNTFHDLWKTLGPSTRLKKNALLAATVVAEAADLLLPQLDALQGKIAAQRNTKFTLEAEALKSIQQQNPSANEKIQQLVRRLRLDIRTRIRHPEDAWHKEIDECNTKSKVESMLDSVLIEFQKHTGSIEQWLITELKQGVKKISQSLWDGDQPLSDAHINKLHGVICEEKEEGEDNGWMWTAGGAAAGAALGIIVSGGLAIPLLLAAGSGGLTNLLLAPLSETKDKAKNEISQGLKQIEDVYLEQLDQINMELEQQVEQLLLSAVRSEIEVKFAEKYEEWTVEIKSIRDFQHRLWNARTRFLRHDQEQKTVAASMLPLPEESVKEHPIGAASDLD